MLRSLVASTEQQNYLGSYGGVINPVAWPDVNAQFPYPIPAEFVIPKVTQFDPVDPAVNRNSRFCIAELTMPLHVDVFLFWRLVMANLVHKPIVVYKRIPCSSNLSILSLGRCLCQPGAGVKHGALVESPDAVGHLIC